MAGKPCCATLFDLCSLDGPRGIILMEFCEGARTRSCSSLPRSLGCAPVLPLPPAASASALPTASITPVPPVGLQAETCTARCSCRRRRKAGACLAGTAEAAASPWTLPRLSTTCTAWCATRWWWWGVLRYQGRRAAVVWRGGWCRPRHQCCRTLPSKPLPHLPPPFLCQSNRRRCTWMSRCAGVEQHVWRTLPLKSAPPRGGVAAAGPSLALPSSSLSVARRPPEPRRDHTS